MESKKYYTGQELKEMLEAGMLWLGKSASEIDGMNVFPVPDGDTGTNMLLTMKSTVQEISRVKDHVAFEIAKAAAYGALLGARGNSGVILSQILCGIAKILEGKESFTSGDWVRGLEEGARAAYKGLNRPVEGTMLTVIRDVAEAAKKAVQADEKDLVLVMETIVAAARESVSRTPLLLPVLREAGVVDAGGQGLYVIFEGALRSLKGEVEEMRGQQPSLVMSTFLPAPSPEPEIAKKPFGYCTEFLIKGQKLDPEKIKRRFQARGQSLIVVGDESLVRVHIHTLDPGSLLHYAISLGTLHDIKIQNMDDLCRDFDMMQKRKVPTVALFVIAVASGEGLTQLFRSLGANSVVAGGQTMNPSVRELLQAVESAPSDKVILLPNDKNVILTASQVQPLTMKEVKVVPTKSIPQGVAALLAFNYEASLEANAQTMEEASTAVTTIEITRAVRSTQIKGLKVKKGEFIALVNGELLASGKSILQIIEEVFLKSGIKETSVVTLYYGAGAKPDEAKKLAQEIGSRYPGAEIEIVNGGQPYYDYIISLE